MPPKTPKPAEKLDPKRLAHALKDKFNTYGGEDHARRLRINAARVSSTTREILAMIGEGGDVPPVERAFLKDVGAFFHELNLMFEIQQRVSKAEKAKAEANWRARREKDIRAAIVEIFGDKPDPAEVLRCGKMLFDFAGNANALDQAKRLRVDRWLFYIERMSEFRAAMASANADALAREIALVKVDGYSRGRYWNDREARCYSAGWEDFNWRSPNPQG